MMVVWLLVLVVEQVELVGELWLWIVLVVFIGKVVVWLVEVVWCEMVKFDVIDWVWFGDLYVVMLYCLLGVKLGVWFCQDCQNWLFYNVIVVDEILMVLLMLMVWLVEVVCLGVWLIFVGDVDQLVLVEVGVVLVDLVDGFLVCDDVLVVQL